MSNLDTLRMILNTNHWIVNAQSEGLTHEESMIQPSFFANCFNWVVGHLVISRGGILHTLGFESPLSRGEYGAVYGRGSERLVDGKNALPLEQLLALYEESQTRLMTALDEVDEAVWQQPVKPESETTVYDRVSFLAWHDSYHSGQLEILRQLANKNDVIIA